VIPEFIVNNSTSVAPTIIDHNVRLAVLTPLPCYPDAADVTTLAGYLPTFHSTFPVSFFQTFNRPMTTHLPLFFTYCCHCPIADMGRARLLTRRISRHRRYDVMVACVPPNSGLFQRF